MIMNKKYMNNAFLAVQNIIPTLFTFSIFTKFPRLFTIPCQWAIKACWAAVLVFEREDPFIKLALDVLGACSVGIGKENHMKPSVRQANMMVIILWTKKSWIPECTSQAREIFLSSNYPGSFHISSPRMP